jgi:hypothetical protein
MEAAEEEEAGEEEAGEEEAGEEDDEEEEGVECEDGVMAEDVCLNGRPWLGQSAGGR